MEDKVKKTSKLTIAIKTEKKDLLDENFMKEVNQQSDGKSTN